MPDDILYEYFDFDESNLIKIFTDHPQCFLKHHDDNPSWWRINYLKDYLKDISVKSMIVEKEYTDRDYLDDYSIYYSKCYNNYERRCIRIHFFKNINCKNLKENVDNYLSNKLKKENVEDILQNNYLGYCVIKPLPISVVGRTVLVAYNHTISDENEGDFQGIRIIRTLRKYSVHILGLTLWVKGLAFIEQDHVIAACATSALWSAMQKTANDFGYNVPTPFQITDNATHYYTQGRPIPSDGLDLSQMSSAVKAVGLEPELVVIEIGSDGSYPNYPLATAYSYLRGGFPAILAVKIPGIGYHAITLTGYHLSETENDDRESENIKITPHLINPLTLKGATIDRLYAHDDQIGPHCKLMVKYVQANGMTNQVLNAPEDESIKWPAPLIPFSILIPVYHKIRVPFSTALLHSTTMESIIAILGFNINIEWDIYIYNVNSYKSEIGTRTDISPNLKRTLLESGHPRFLWRARAFNSNSKKELLELLIDATDMKDSYQIYRIPIFDNELARAIIDNRDRILEVVETSPNMLDTIERFLKNIKESNQ